MGIFKKDEPIEGPVTPEVGSVEMPRQKSVIGRTLFIKGEINSDEEVLIEGRVEGKININHRVVIGRSGIVNADIEAKEVIIKGTLTGNLKCSYKVEIVPDGSLTGNIVSHRVVLAEGAIFIGNIAMTDENGKLIGAKKEETKPHTPDRPKPQEATSPAADDDKQEDDADQDTEEIGDKEKKHGKKK